MTVSRRMALFLTMAYIALISGFLTWASLDTSVFTLPATLTQEPWFITTCIDAWMGLFVITLWAWCFESTWFKRGLWFVLIMGFGNVGVGLYLIKRILTLPEHFTLKDLFLKVKY